MKQGILRILLHVLFSLRVQTYNFFPNFAAEYNLINAKMEQNDFEHVNKMVVDLIESVYEVSKIAGAL